MVPKVVSDIVSQFQGIYLVKHQEFRPEKRLIMALSWCIKATIGVNLNWVHKTPLMVSKKLATDKENSKNI